MSELIADYIDTAMDLIEERGLAKRSLQNKQGAVCMQGGLNIAIHGVARPGVPFFYQKDSPLELALNAILAAIHATGSRATSVTGWNDYGGRTIEQVLDVGRAAAKAERMQP